MGRCLLLAVLLGALALASGCERNLQLSVLFSDQEDLKSGDRVFTQGQSIGEVKEVVVNPGEKVRARLTIREPFRDRVTDQARFVVRPDPEKGSGGRAVEMVVLRPGGRQVVEGAEVDGSSPLTVRLEQGSRDIQEWGQRFRGDLERWEKDLRQLTDKEWTKELERKMEEWRKELEKGGAEVQKRFQREVLPRLEEALRELRKRLEKDGRGKEAEPLERRLKELETI